MPYSYSSLWRSIPNDMEARLERCLAEAMDMHAGRGAIPVFFRADDIAVPGKQLKRLIETFQRYNVPLSMAVVPVWLTAPRWEAIQRICSDKRGLWCFYQHGWRHMNHEPGGKKQEFGPARSNAAIEHDLVRGKHRLASLMKQRFYQAFTPPWNRCSQEALSILKSLGYRVVSRSQGALPPAPAGLMDFQVNVDLHTRKEAIPEAGWENLLDELRMAVSLGFCGIMIHHQRMNENGFLFLERLLEKISTSGAFRTMNLKDLAERTSISTSINSN